MHVQTHWQQEKDLTPPTTTSSDTQSVYMCAHERGLVVWRKVATCQYGAYQIPLSPQHAGTNITGKLLKEAATDAASCWEKNGSVLTMFFSSSSSSSRKKNKDGRCISMINSVLIQSPEPVVADLRRYDALINAPGYTGGNAHSPNA